MSYPPAARSGGELRLTESVLKLFEGKPSLPSGTRPLFEHRKLLDVEFTITPYPYGFRKTMFAAELKLGPKRLYGVPKLRELLDSIERGKPYPLTRHFAYDPAEHTFRPEDDALLRLLARMVRDESLYAEASSPYTLQGHSRSRHYERMLPIPPVHWESFSRLASAAAQVTIELQSGTYSGISYSAEPLPLRFEFNRDDSDGYRLELAGYDQLEIMEPYGLVAAEGKLYMLPDEHCGRLVHLLHMVESSGQSSIRIAREQMEPFMETVIPGLLKLGHVAIAPAVADRIMQAPLRAKLYLDRVRDKLLAGLEFQYGDIVFDPLAENVHSRGEERILMRDRERESRILELMEQPDNAKTEGGYIYSGEEAEYDFLYHAVPELEKLLNVYATSAVKERIIPVNPEPKITVNVDERTEWLHIGFAIDGIREADIRGVLKALEERRRYYRMPSGALLPMEGESFQELVRFMNEVGVRSADVAGASVRLPAVRGLRLIDAGQPGSVVKLGKPLRQLLDSLRNPDPLEYELPDHLSGILRDYQKYGYGWMRTVAHYRFGGILADDMGLGKTVQSIAFLVSMLPDIRSRRQPALIVAPASLVYNWQNELHKFAPGVRAVIADGTKPEREKLIRDAGQADVIITSYPLLRKDIASYAGQEYHTLLLDEAQAFKNYTTQTAQAVKRLRADYRFALTGTPIENSLEELWSIFEAVFPGLFPARKAFGEMPRETIAKRIRPFMLRRVKGDVLKELPDKIETLQTSELLTEQKKLYLAYLAKLRHETVKHLNEESFYRNRIQILAGLTRLRQLCCHPALFVEGYTGSSGKFEQLLDIVEECRSSGRRALIFSQFTEMLSLIAREFGAAGIPFFYLDGQTPAAERVQLCSRFNEGEKEMFLISLKAGGTGLNLTGADTVILYDLWWNPAVEQQAADRAHRIGQKKVVHLIRLLSQGTVEEKMFELQQKKQNLIDEMIEPGHEALSSLTEQDIRELLSI
ncbi:DEAD/DEAH box helicase [Paenibacillus ginsengarvi]|nr:DEAD/DEAH box helicase [Paenibacillus ginsengarvi]